MGVITWVWQGSLSVASAAAFGALCLASSPASAATITEFPTSHFPDGRIDVTGTSDTGIQFSLDFAPFDVRLGTLDAAIVSFAGTVTADETIRITVPGVTLPSFVNVVPVVELFLDPIFPSTNFPSETIATDSPTETHLIGTPRSFSFAINVPLTPSFVASPGMGIGAATLTESIPITSVTLTDNTRLLGTLSLAFVYTPVPEPISASILAVALVGLAASRRKGRSDGGGF